MMLFCRIFSSSVHTPASSVARISDGRFVLVVRIAFISRSRFLSGSISPSGYMPVSFPASSASQFSFTASR